MTSALGHLISQLQFRVAPMKVAHKQHFVLVLYFQVHQNFTLRS